MTNPLQNTGRAGYQSNNSDLNCTRDSFGTSTMGLNTQKASLKKNTFEDVALLIYQKKQRKQMLTEDEKAQVFRNKIEKLTNISVDEQENMQLYMEM